MASKVLLMDDEQDTLQMLAMTLRFSGFDVRTAETGKRAISLASEAMPDLIILDVMMPDISGIDVLRAIKKDALKLPPVIFLSASIRPEDKQQGLAEGAFTYLVKPILREKLLETLRAALAARSQ
jgi:two-component system OmpR family response regulator